MRFLVLFFFAPLFGSGQIIHTEDDSIVYRGNVNVAGYTAAALTEALNTVAPKSKATYQQLSSDTSLTSQWTMPLRGPYHIVRTLHFRLAVQPDEHGYRYVVDGVFVKERKRYSRTTLFHSKELLEAMEETGLVAIGGEQTLNEVDLRIQKILRQLENEIRVRSAPTSN